MALRLQELHPDREWVFFCTPTGDELPEMITHWAALERLLGQRLTRITNQTLNYWIDYFDMLPNGHARWCTRILKIEPCIAYLKHLEETTGERPHLYVGLRADEEERKGLYSEQVITKFPLREWGWGLSEVWAYIRKRGVSIPKRTDCARCYGQRLSEWWRLWKQHPELYAEAEEQERKVGEVRETTVTFRSRSRDTWPAGLADLRARFEAGDLPRGIDRQVSMFGDDEHACRVCSL